MLKQLKPFQEAGRDFLATHPHALLADEMGTGKTVQAIAAVEKLALKRVLVICPASVRLGWAQELQECLGRRDGWDIISYHGATNYRNKRVEPIGPWEAVILDESHFLKTPQSQRTQAVFGPAGLARRATRIWCLSGTPVLNRPVELWPMLKTLHPAFAAMSFTKYTQRYCAAYFDGYTINTKGASHLDELSGLLKSFMLRRTKAEVLPELPPKIISRIPLDVSQKELADVWAEEAKISNREAKISSIAEDFSQLGDISRLLRLTGLAKVSAAVGFISDLLETTGKVVVFAKHRDVIARTADALRAKGFGVVTYIGGMNDEQKKTAVKDFQGEKAQVFLGNIQAAGTGINGLTVSAAVVFAELDWTPGAIDQAGDRVHRMGQKAECVNVYLLHIPGTLESAILGVLAAKEMVIEKLMGDA